MQRGRLPNARSLWQRMRHIILWTHRQRIVGWVDGRHGDHFDGWAFDRRHPRRRLTVDIVGEAGQWSVVADRYRADVHQAHRDSDGYCGFSLPAARLAAIRSARVYCGGPKVALLSNAVDTSRPAGKAFHYRDCIGFVDEDDPAVGIGGWMRNAAAPHARSLVSLACDGRIVGSQSATLYRADSRGAGGDGFHGFSFGPVVGVTGRWSLLEAASGVEIRLSP